MRFDDRTLQEYYDRDITRMAALPSELRPICALMDAYGWFTKVDGSQGPRPRAILRHLSAPESRSALRNWCRTFGADMNPTAKELHAMFEQTVGEKLAPPANDGHTGL